MESHKKYEKLIEKIDSQTEFIRQGFQEMNQNFKLPKISNQNEQNYSNADEEHQKKLL